MFLPFVLSSKQKLYNKKSRPPKKNYKEFSKKENNKKVEVLQSQRKLPEPIIYQGEIQRNILLEYDDNDGFKQHRERSIKESRAITNYFQELHKDMVNSYTVEYTNLLQNILNSSWDDYTNRG